MVKRFLPLIIIALGVGGFMLLKASRPDPVPVASTERAWLVDTMTVQKDAHTPVLPLYGQLVAPEQVRLSAPLGGRIAERPVREGQKVREGELLVAMDRADVEPLLARARADVADLEAQIESENVRFANNKRALESEQSILDSAQRQYERTKSLVARNLSSQEDLDAAADALARARLTVTARKQSIDEHPSRLKSLKARLERAQAALDTVELDAARARVTAPFDGVVTGIQVAEGDRVSPNSPLLSIYPTDGLELRATVPDRYRQELLSALAEGDELEAVSQDREHRFALARFAGTSDPAGTEVILSLKSAADGRTGQGLRPGGLMPVNLERPAVDSSVAIPFSALYGSDSIYVMTDDQRMQRLRVERLGEVPQVDGQRYVLVSGSGLSSGQQLIKTHLPNAMTGLKVQVAGGNGGAEE